MAAVQSWPPLISAPAVAPRAAASRSASAWTMNGALPPSSRWTRLTLFAASAWIRLPVSESPVSEMRSTSMCAAIAAPTTSPRPVTTLRTPAGNPGLRGQLGQPDRRDRRRAGRLEDDRVAGRERRADLPDRHPERVVPRRHLGHHPDRLAPDHRRVAAAVLVRGLALQMADLAGEEAQVVRGEGEVRLTPELVGGPRLLGLDEGQFVGVLVAQVGQSVHRRDAVGQAHPRPAAVPEGRAGGRHGTVDVRLGPGRDPSDQLAGRRAVDLEPRSAQRGGGGAVDEHRVVGGDLDGHLGSPRGAAARRAARWVL